MSMSSLEKMLQTQMPTGISQEGNSGGPATVRYQGAEQAPAYHLSSVNPAMLQRMDEAQKKG